MAHSLSRDLSWPEARVLVATGLLQPGRLSPALGPSSSTVLDGLIVKLLTLSGKDGPRPAPSAMTFREPRRPQRPPDQQPLNFTPGEGGGKSPGEGNNGRRQNGCLGGTGNQAGSPGASILFLPRAREGNKVWTGPGRSFSSSPAFVSLSVSPWAPSSSGVGWPPLPCLPVPFMTFNLRSRGQLTNLLPSKTEAAEGEPRPSMSCKVHVLPHHELHDSCTRFNPTSLEGRGMGNGWVGVGAAVSLLLDTRQGLHWEGCEAPVLLGTRCCGSEEPTSRGGALMEKWRRVNSPPVSANGSQLHATLLPRKQLRLGSSDFWSSSAKPQLLQP